VTGTIDLNALQQGSVPVSITVSLFAGPTGDMEITSANVVAEIKPLPTGPVVPRDGGTGGGILQNPDPGNPPPAANDRGDNRGRGRDEDEDRRGNSGGGRGQGGRESGRGSGR